MIIKRFQAKTENDAVEIAQIVEDAGASAITVHPRTKDQGYSGKADWSIIKEVKENVDVPVIGNGDIKSCFDAKRMLDETDCDAVMIGRAALGNPWLIRDCVNYLENGTLPEEVTIEERMEMEQFTECDITLRELGIIRNTITNTLSGVYHERVKYPKLKTGGRRSG